MSEFILFANVHGLGIRVILTFVEDARKSTLELRLVMELEDAVVEEGCESFRKITKTRMDRLVLLHFEVRIFVDCEFIDEMWIIMLWLCNNSDDESILGLEDFKSQPIYLIRTLLPIKRRSLDFHGAGRNLP